MQFYKHWLEKISAWSSSKPPVQPRNILVALLICVITTGNILVLVAVPYFDASTVAPFMFHFMLKIFAALSVLNIICMIAIFRWKRWGFYAYTLSTLFSAAISAFVTRNWLYGVTPLCVVLLLYLALKLGKTPGWSLLK